MHPGPLPTKNERDCKRMLSGFTRTTRSARQSVGQQGLSCEQQRSFSLRATEKQQTSKQTCHWLSWEEKKGVANIKGEDSARKPDSVPLCGTAGVIREHKLVVHGRSALQHKLVVRGQGCCVMEVISLALYFQDI
eukprot:gb/GEZN01021820.1/.p1 GENE.gb/GEZN01021820.1/~~gb/GEZN01021820.1/.p1  ORF type:complete len:135 (+),score=10.17 gb/GEZN01021820.1/:173-577(+)